MYASDIPDSGYCMKLISDEDWHYGSLNSKEAEVFKVSE